MKKQQQAIKIDYTDAAVIKCTARTSFTHNGQHITAGQTFYLVASASQAGEYHLVAWNESRSCWSCSCGAACKKHSHTTSVNEYIRAQVAVVKPAQVVSSNTAVSSSRQPVVSVTHKRAEYAPLNGNRAFSVLKKSA
jgi:hypothetical protein